RAVLAGHGVLPGGGGRAVGRADGGVFPDGPPPTAGGGPGGGGGGPLQRRAELEGLEREVREAEATRGHAAAALEQTLAELAAGEAALTAAAEAAERARQQELEAGAATGDAQRTATHAQREAADAATQVERLSRR